jgi:hypothetical protein
VKRGPKGAGEGGTGELTEGERNGGAKTVRRRRSRRPGADTRPRREGEGVTGCSGALMREDERGEKGGRGTSGWGTARKRCHTAARGGEGCGTSAAVRWRGVAGNGPAAALTADACTVGAETGER